MDKGRQRDGGISSRERLAKIAKHATLDGYSRSSAKDQSGVREREGALW